MSVAAVRCSRGETKPRKAKTKRDNSNRPASLGDAFGLHCVKALRGLAQATRDTQPRAISENILHRHKTRLFLTRINARDSRSGTRKARYCSVPQRSTAGSAEAHFHWAPCLQALAVNQYTFESGLLPSTNENANSLHVASALSISRVTRTSP